MCVGIVKFDQRLPNFSEKGGGSGQQDSSQATLVFDTPELGDVLFSILYVTLCSLRSAIAIKTGADTTVWSQAAEHHSAEGFIWPFLQQSSLLFLPKTCWFHQVLESCENHADLPCPMHHPSLLAAWRLTRRFESVDKTVSGCDTVRTLVGRSIRLSQTTFSGTRLVVAALGHSGVLGTLWAMALEGLKYGNFRPQSVQWDARAPHGFGLTTDFRLRRWWQRRYFFPSRRRKSSDHWDFDCAPPDRPGFADSQADGRSEAVWRRRCQSTLEDLGAGLATVETTSSNGALQCRLSSRKPVGWADGRLPSSGCKAH